MAYIDSNRHGVNPVGAGVAVALHGVAILAIVLAGSTIVKAGADFVPTLTTFTPDEPPPPPPAAQPIKRKAPPPTAAPEFSRSKAQVESTNTLTDAIGKPVELIRPVDPPPVAPQPPEHIPLLKVARLDPRFASALQPEYPPSMIRADMEGTVTVRVLIGADGRVKDVNIVTAASDEFAEATRKQALKKWRFLPATRDGEAYESWREMTVRFVMPE